MLILRVFRWRRHPAWQGEDTLPPQLAAVDEEGWQSPAPSLPCWPALLHWGEDEALPGASNFFLEDDASAQAPITLPATPCPCAALAVLWVNDDTAPALLAGDEDGWIPLVSWGAPPVWQDRRAVLPAQEDGDLPGAASFLLDEDSWGPGRPWDREWPGFALSADEEFPAALGLDDEGFLPRPPLGTPWSTQLLGLEDGDLPGAVSFFLEDDGWVPLSSWGASSAQTFHLGDVDELPGVAFGFDEENWSVSLAWPDIRFSIPVQGDEALPGAANFFLDEDGWLPYRPSDMRWATPLLHVDEEDLPSALLSFLEDEGWRPRASWMAWTILPSWGEDSDVPGVFSLEDDDWHVWPSWEAWAWHLAVPFWPDDDLPPAPLPFGLDEEGWRPPGPWSRWPLPRVWLKEDEYPTPPLPLGIEEDAWIPLRPWVHNGSGIMAQWFIAPDEDAPSFPQVAILGTWTVELMMQASWSIQLLP